MGMSALVWVAQALAASVSMQVERTDLIEGQTAALQLVDGLVDMEHLVDGAMILSGVVMEDGADGED